MNKELRREVSEGHADAKSEQAMEGMIQFMRWSNRVEPRIRESNGDLGAIGAGTARAMMEQSRQLTSNRAGATWTLIGPKSTPSNGGNGRVNAVRAHPTTPTTLFACTPAGGLWKTTNSGTSWTPIADGIALLGATDVAFDPTNPNDFHKNVKDNLLADALKNRKKGCLGIGGVSTKKIEEQIDNRIKAFDEQFQLEGDPDREFVGLSNIIVWTIAFGT